MIVSAIRRAYKTMRERGWNKIYWAIDLHGVCLRSNYHNGGYEFINPDTVRGLQKIASRPENVLILWSSCHPHEQPAIIQFFADHGIRVDFFNENPLEENTKTGCFDKKFYFSVLLDDKAGFDPNVDWQSIMSYYQFEEVGD